MIENHDMGGFVLTCDICEEESGEGFDEYSDVVRFKKDLSNNWASNKDEFGNYLDVCPTCNESRSLNAC